ncbi:MAG: MarR family transcriptional regulator [Devosia sp.]
MIDPSSPFVLAQAVATLGKGALLARLAACGHGEVGMPDVKLLWCLGAEPVNVQQVAEMTGTTKQFAARTVAKLRESGLVRVSPAPNDKRSIAITATRKGEALLAIIRSEKDAIEAEWRAAIGATAFEAIARALARLIDGPLK